MIVLGAFVTGIECILTTHTIIAVEPVLAALDGQLKFQIVSDIYNLRILV